MTVLVTGGSKSGKSAFSEHLLDSFSGEKYYIATMLPFGEEAFAAISRHQRMRKGKGFQTIDCYSCLSTLTLMRDCGVLLECMGNLCANEMFCDDGIHDPVQPILDGISHIQTFSKLLVIVTNEVGADGIHYSAETMDYIRSLAEINRRIAEASDVVVECCAGIPHVLKGDLPC